ncbi:MAG: cold shock and DUF1294 domain-containing protein [Propionicimonas sp.]|nr:cold shock and DUF1294 domain-containing protein [Propionicimonas sp.]
MAQGRTGVVGSLASWDDERGFGFIQPNEGGQQVFVHVSGFRERSRHPVTGDVVVFDVVAGDGGRPRAADVQFVDQVVARPGPERSQRGRLRPIALLPVALFAAYLAVAIAVWGVPWWVPAVYLGMSVLTFVLYARDKRLARAGEWRVPEATLQLAGLACGWPGGALAQQFLRHKNRKRSFQLQFWVLAALNVVLLAILVHETGLLR